jgi:lipopolysaccharide export LptBFGC system permease protein LptF
MHVYNKLEGKCNYNLILLQDLFLNRKTQVLSFASANLFYFRDCAFTENIILQDGKINDNEGNIELEGEVIDYSNAKIFKEKFPYEFKIFLKSFEEKVNLKSYKTFIEIIVLMKQFAKVKVNYRNLQFEMIDLIQKVISFFYMIVTTFVFFAKIPPRGQVIGKIFISICFISSLYIVNMILSAYLKKSIFLSPLLALILPSITLFIMSILLILKRS